MKGSCFFLLPPMLVIIAPYLNLRKQRKYTVVVSADGQLF